MSSSSGTRSVNKVVLHPGHGHKWTLFDVAMHGEFDEFDIATVCTADPRTGGVLSRMAALRGGRCIGFLGTGGAADEICGFIAFGVTFASWAVLALACHRNKRSCTGLVNDGRDGHIHVSAKLAFVKICRT